MCPRVLRAQGVPRALQCGSCATRISISAGTTSHWAAAALKSARQFLCELYHTLRTGRWCILISKLPPPGSKGAVGRHSLTYFGFTITQLFTGRRAARSQRASEPSLHQLRMS